jgi:hypothetical protein
MPATTGLSVAQAADPEGTGAVVGEGGDELRQQRLQALALLWLEDGQELGELTVTSGQHSSDGRAPRFREVESKRAVVGAGTPLEQPVRRETVDDLDRCGLRDPEHPGERLNRCPRVGVQVDQGGRVGAGPPNRHVDSGSEPVGGREGENSQQLGETVGDPTYITLLCVR